jgi:hypothetical protein
MEQKVWDLKEGFDLVVYATRSNPPDGLGSAHRVCGYMLYEYTRAMNFVVRSESNQSIILGSRVIGIE